MNTSEEFYKHFPHLTWVLNPRDIKTRVERLIDEAKERIDSVLALSDDEMNYDTVVETLALDEVVFEREKNIIELFYAISPLKTLVATHNAIRKFCNHTEMRKDLYDIYTKIRMKEQSLPLECDLYLNRIILQRKRNRIDLPKEDQEKVEQNKREIINLCDIFKKNVAAENTPIKLERTELFGMSNEFISNLDMENNEFIVTLSDFHRLEILKYCKVISTRQKIQKAYHSLGMHTNVPILEKIVKLRHQSAQILGYSNHMDFVTETLISKKASNVLYSLSTMTSNLAESSSKEKDRLLNLKQQDCEEMGIFFDGKIHLYDHLYYQRMVEERDYSVNQNIIKEYFQIDHVTEVILEIYQSIFQLCFYEVFGTKTWHPDVRLYSICDKDSGDLLGYFYLDLFARPGKNTEKNAFPIQCACVTENGYQLSCAALLLNFDEPKENKPTLLTHIEVVTYFNKFCFLMHIIICKTRYIMFGATSLESDFLYTSAFMLENWAWEEDVVRKLSSHYITKEKLSDDLITKLCNSRKANASLKIMFQVMFYVLDYRLHTSSEVDALEVYEECLEKYTSLIPIPGTNPTSSFIQMCRGLDAVYYGHLWCEVFAADIFLSKFKKEGIFNSKIGRSYRKNIMEPGSTKNANELLKNMLGRNHILKSFLKINGVI